MVSLILFACVVGSTLATSPIINETEDSNVPVSKPVVSVPRRCPPNEVLKSRVSCPPDTCDTLYLSFLCIADQIPSVVCTCKDGYLRTNSSSTGVCVPTDRCLPPECADDPNAQRGCGNRCKKTCSDYNDTNKICKNNVCKVFGCGCKDGLVYDENINKCVKPAQCTKQCKKPHERYSNCLLGECVPKTCDDLGKPIACPSIASPCAGGCICEEGYVRDSNGDCIDKKKCPSCGGDPNAESGCGNPCGKTCASLNTNNTNLVCPLYCEVNGCDCKKGYLLNTDTKKCVLEKKCPKPPQKCGQNEEYYCGTSCAEPSCKNPQPPKCVNKKCKLACFCKKGYVRDSNNKCIAVDKCPKQCKKPHERYSNCLLGECVPKTCDDLGKPIACPSIASPCAGGCICEEGYVRDSNGDCIDKKKCPSCGGDPNAESGCGNPCGKTCASLNTNKTNLVCPLYCEVNGCDCKKGYLLNTDTKKCVLEKKCPKPPQKCGQNEEYYCGTSCAEPSCKNPQPPKCVNKKCKLACFCKKGYVRDSNNKCIAVDKCPKQCKKPHERYSNCLLGECVPKTCDDLGKPIACPSIASPCAGGCICDEGYVRDSNGDCIDKKRCPSCGGDPNAESGCGNPCGKTCASLNANKTNLFCPLYCEVNGCDCKKGYLLNTDTKKCVLEKNCPKPPQNCGQNEEYYCGTSCAEPSCKNPQPPKCVNKKCKLACFCKKGYVRDSNNKCIAVDKCPKQCKKPHERYSNCLLGECVPKTCDDLGKPIACPSIASPCAGGCICEEGYVRDSNGDCIDKKRCPSCGGDPNAESGCGNPCGKTCASLNANKTNLFCPLYCEVNGCDCKKGYLLNTDTKKCVLEKNCPKPPQNCGQNEEYYCGTSCAEPSCKNPQPPKCVNKKCKLACFCKKGYVRDANNKCIAVDKCPSPCKGPHERYISCPAGQCGPKTCDNLINPAPCPRIIPPCPGGCICEEGYLRNSNGICIEKKRCPQLACNSNQTYVSCNVNCSDKYCPKDDKPQSVCDAPINCPPGCTCKINYRLNKYGKCILASECPAINCTRQNEEYNSCPSDCLAENCEDADTPPAVCNTLLLNCQPKCICKKGHFRNKLGRCIPAKECPSVCKDPNAQWKDCKDPCPGTCQNTKPLCKSKTCTAGCQCNDGYVLSKPYGKCVKIEDCADYVKCPGNQTFVPCTFRCPQVMCPKSDQTILCKPPRDCPGGCGCKPNYRYNYDDECILGSECPPVECTRKNEVWDPCRSEYDWERCEDRFNTPPINPVEEYCNPRCVCKKGYYKINIDECVPESECPP